MNRRTGRATTAGVVFGLITIAGGLALAQDTQPLRNTAYDNSPTGYTVSGDKQSMSFYGKSSRLIMEHRSASPAARDFLKNVAVIDKAEVMLGQLALQKSSNDKVKQFAQMMIDDHNAAQAEVTKLASDADVNLPDQLDAKSQAAYDRLNSLSGDAFDKAYMRAMVTGHMEAAKLFQRMANNGKNSDTRMWAASSVSLIRKHRDMARDIATSIGAWS